MANRVATHNGRAGKKGAYSARHNDRDFDLDEAPHIDPTLTPFNQNVRYAGELKATTNVEYEMAFYEAHFGASLARKNAAYREKGKKSQIKTMEQYYRAVKSCPEETLFTAGKDIDPQLLWNIYGQYQAWKAEAFPQCQTLTASLHVDEPDAMPHIHERSVWIGHDAHGMEVVGQAKALAEMGVLPPDPQQKYGQHNNAKQTFSAACRQKFLDLCKSHGLEIIEEPLPKDKVGLELTEYKIQHAEERLQKTEANIAAAKTKMDNYVASKQRELLTVSHELQETRKSVVAVKGEYEALEAEIAPLRDLKADKEASDVPALPSRLHPDEVRVKKTDFEALQQQANAYAVNQEKWEKLKSLENEQYIERKKLDRLGEELQAKDKELTARERAVASDERLLANAKSARADADFWAIEYRKIQGENDGLRRLLGIVKIAIQYLVKKLGADRELTRYAEAINDVIGDKAKHEVSDVLDDPVGRAYRDRLQQEKDRAEEERRRREQERQKRLKEQAKEREHSHSDRSDR